jgi:hypothetical protein
MAHDESKWQAAVNRYQIFRLQKETKSGGRGNF